MSTRASEYSGDAMSTVGEGTETVPPQAAPPVSSGSPRGRPSISPSSKYQSSKASPVPRDYLARGDCPDRGSHAAVVKPQVPSENDSPQTDEKEKNKPRGPVARFFLSLRFLLAAFCVVAIFVAAFLAWYLTYTTGLDTVQSLSKEFEMQLLPQISDSVVSRLSRAETLVQVNKELWHRGSYSLDPQSYLPNFHALLFDCKFTSTVTFTSATGGLYGHFRHPDGAYTSVWLYDEATKNQ
eukprot:RCo001506